LLDLFFTQSQVGHKWHIEVALYHRPARVSEHDGQSKDDALAVIAGLRRRNLARGTRRAQTKTRCGNRAVATKEKSKDHKRRSGQDAQPGIWVRRS